MRQIYIDKQVVNIPQSWDELTQEQYVFIAGQLYKHSIGEIDFAQVQLISVCKIINLQIIKAQERIPFGRLINYLLEIWKINFTRIYKRISREDYIAWRSAAKDCYLQHDVKEDLLAFNLIQIAQEIPFLEMDNFKILFLKNPVPKLPGIGKGKSFDIGVLINTDITAGTYADVMDMVMVWEETKNSNDIILSYIIGLLYTNKSAQEIMKNSKFLEAIGRVDFATKYAIYLWFVSISTYFITHPVYTHLYQGRKQEGDKVRLGMGEAIIRLSKNGYGTIKSLRNENLISFMDIQVAELKETIRGALAAGIEPTKLAEKTGRTLTQIDQLS